MKFKITLIDLPGQKVHEDIDCYFILGDEVFVWHGEFYVFDLINVEDKELGFKKDSEYTCFTCVKKKETITGVDCDYVESGDYWYIQIIFFGSSSDIKLYFSTKGECLAIHQKIINWVFGKVLPLG